MWHNLVGPITHLHGTSKLFVLFSVDYYNFFSFNKLHLTQNIVRSPAFCWFLKREIKSCHMLMAQPSTYDFCMTFTHLTGAKKVIKYLEIFIDFQKLNYSSEEVVKSTFNYHQFHYFLSILNILQKRQFLKLNFPPQPLIVCIKP